MFWSKKKSKNNPSKGQEIVFEYFDPNAKAVFLCGDFNSWSILATPLRLDATGRWTVSVSLAPGRHEYRFLVDGLWCNDQRPVYLIDNTFGTQNCLIEI